MGTSRKHITFTFLLLLLIMIQTCPAAAAAKSLQSCPTLCDPIDGSPPGSAIPGTRVRMINDFFFTRVKYSRDMISKVLFIVELLSCLLVELFDEIWRVSGLWGVSHFVLEGSFASLKGSASQGEFNWKY